MGLQQVTALTKAFTRWKQTAPEPAGGVDRLFSLAEQSARAPDGEWSALQSAQQLAQHLATLDINECQSLIQQLVPLGPCEQQLDRAAQWPTDTPEQRWERQRQLQCALYSPRQALWRRLAGVDGGLRQLVALRESLFPLLKKQPSLRSLEAELAGLLAERFNLGLLEHRELTWSSGADVLENLMAYEAVHAFQGWADLRHRLRGADRRCFALFHPQLPELPVAFVEVALDSELATSVQAILDQDAPVCPASDANWTVFYAISNTLQGLKGIAFGEYLIKTTAAALQRELPSLKGFSTLSPIPGFRRWLEHASDSELDLPAKLLKQLGGSRPSVETLCEKLDIKDPHANSAATEFLGYTCHRYLGQRRDDGNALDPVARFHLGNGARVERLTTAADTSPKGIAQSLGMMVNYRYPLTALELANNRQRYCNAELPAAVRKPWQHQPKL